MCLGNGIVSVVVEGRHNAAFMSTTKFLILWQTAKSHRFVFANRRHFVDFPYQVYVLCCRCSCIEHDIDARQHIHHIMSDWNSMHSCKFTCVCQNVCAHVCTLECASECTISVLLYVLWRALMSVLPTVRLVVLMAALSWILSRRNSCRNCGRSSWQSTRVFKWASVVLVFWYAFCSYCFGCAGREFNVRSYALR